MFAMMFSFSSKVVHQCILSLSKILFLPDELFGLKSLCVSVCGDWFQITSSGYSNWVTFMDLIILIFAPFIPFLSRGVWRLLDRCVLRARSYAFSSPFKELQDCFWSVIIWVSETDHPSAMYWLAITTKILGTLLLNVSQFFCNMCHSIGTKMLRWILWCYDIRMRKVNVRKHFVQYLCYFKS